MRFFWLLLALHVLNLSADVAGDDCCMTPNRPVNEMESLTEVLTETLLGFDNVFEESGEPDECPAGTTVKKPSFFCCQTGISPHTVIQRPPMPCTLFSPLRVSPFLLHAEVPSPPPEC